MREKIVCLGRSKEQGSAVWLYDFSYDCDWYWGGGYLGNNNLHYHLESYMKKGMSFHETLKADFKGLDEKLDLWRFCDLFIQFYAYKKAAECFQYGGHQTSRGRTEAEINKTMADRINSHIKNVIIPEIYKVVGHEKAI